MNDEVNPADLPLLLRGSVQPGDYLTSNVANRLLYAAADYIESKLADEARTHDAPPAPVAWRWRPKVCVPNGRWHLSSVPNYDSPYVECEPLYAAPPSTSVGQEIAYLDLGVGGYIDLGSAMTDEQLAKLPKGRHALGIIGTYGVDGYVAAPPAAQAVDLPDDLSESKDWRESDYNGRIEWLKAMHASQRAEIVRMQNDVEILRALIDQQAGKGGA